MNTGWTAGGYGVGYRMKLKHTRSIIDAIHSGELLDAECAPTPIFGLQVGARNVLKWLYAHVSADNVLEPGCEDGQPAEVSSACQGCGMLQLPVSAACCVCDLCT